MLGNAQTNNCFELEGLSLLWDVGGGWVKGGGGVDGGGGGNRAQSSGVLWKLRWASGSPVPNKLYGCGGRKATWKKKEDPEMVRAWLCVSTAGPWSCIIRAVSASETNSPKRRALTLRLFYAWLGGSASLAIKGVASDRGYFAWWERKDKTDVSHERSTKRQQMVLHWGWPVAVLVAVLQRSLTWPQVSSQMLRAVSLMLRQWRFYEQRSTSIWPNSAWTRSSKLFLFFWRTELCVCVGGGGGGGGGYFAVL